MCNVIILVEAASDRRFKCPYCDFRATREELVAHVEEEHDDMIPEKMTPAQVVFNFINKKDHGTCVIDKKETAWDEDAWRYKRFCCDKCKAIANENAKKNMIGKYGKTTLLGDMEHQKKMLAARKISGTYKFSDGGEVTYTGSYERNRLEFMDKVMGIPSADIQSPGPIIEYEYKGEKLQWITDSIYLPYNLVFDDKAGGSNPNTHPDQQEYRDKQLAKEKAIKETGLYNYIRLTDNDFSQLVEVMMELKKRMISDDSQMSKEPIIMVNESSYQSSTNKNEIYFVAYGSEYIMEGVALCASLDLDKFILCDMETGALVKSDRTFFEDKICHILSFESENVSKIYEEVLGGLIGMNPRPMITPTLLPSTFAGKEISLGDLFTSGAFTLLITQPNGLKDYSVEKIIKNIIDSSKDQKFEFDILTESAVDINRFKNFPAIKAGQDINGFFIRSENTGLRSRSVKSLEEISILEAKIIDGGI